ncbi:uncharacterized protein DS421_5g164380 [Arachis hypogaea]|nr:uncharacterized protein DS421_5g164380 [Arachis hypogaea]
MRSSSSSSPIFFFFSHFFLRSHCHYEHFCCISFHDGPASVSTTTSTSPDSNQRRDKRTDTPDHRFLNRGTLVKIQVHKLNNHGRGHSFPRASSWDRSEIFLSV